MKLSIKRFCIIFIVVLFGIITFNKLYNPVYCPLMSFKTRHIMLPAYLKLGRNNQPEYIEVRRFNFRPKLYRFNDEVIIRCFGAEKIEMKLDYDGVIFKFYSDTLGIEPDTSILIDVYDNYDYQEIYIGK